MRLLAVLIIIVIGAGALGCLRGLSKVRKYQEEIDKIGGL